MSKKLKIIYAQLIVFPVVVEGPGNFKGNVNNNQKKRLWDILVNIQDMKLCCKVCLCFYTNFGKWQLQAKFGVNNRVMTFYGHGHGGKLKVICCVNFVVMQ